MRSSGSICEKNYRFVVLTYSLDGESCSLQSLIHCSVSGPVAYFFKEGSNQWWTAVQVRNHRHGIAKFEYDSGGGNFVEVARESYNYFVEPAGMGPGPYTFRVTDVYGGQVTDSGVLFAEASLATGAAQLPACQ